MNSNKIEIGDTVMVRYYEYTDDIEGVVIHIPSDVGDMWHIQTKKEIMAVNPNCSILVSISKRLYD